MPTRRRIASTTIASGMAQQFGLAMMPSLSRILSALTSGTRSGTVSASRQARPRSTASAPDSPPPRRAGAITPIISTCVLNIVDILITIVVLTPIAILLAAAGYIGFLVLFRRWTIYTLRTDEPLLANPGADDRREAEKPSPA